MMRYFDQSTGLSFAGIIQVRFKGYNLSSRVITRKHPQRLVAVQRGG